MKSLKIAALLTTLAVPSYATDLDNLTDADRSNFREEVRAYLLENPEVILEAMQVLRDRETRAEAQADERLLSQLNDEIFNDGVSYVGGNPDGDVTIVEFVDYRCGYCRKAHSDMSQLLKNDGNIRLIVKEFPILGPDSDTSAAMAVATLLHFGSEAYGRLHEVLISFKGPVNEKTMPQIAKEAEVDFEPIKGLLNGPAVQQHITRMHRLGQQLNITGTPAFVVKSGVLRGYIPLSEMEQLVAEVRAN